MHYKTSAEAGCRKCTGIYDSWTGQSDVVERKTVKVVLNGHCKTKTLKMLTVIGSDVTILFVFLLL